MCVAFGYSSDSNKHFAFSGCNMHTSSQPQFQPGNMHHSATMMPAQPTAHPRTGGYGPVGQTINRAQQHSQPQPFPPPPPPPNLPSPPPGTFTNPNPLPTFQSPSPSQTSTQATPSPSQHIRSKPQALPPADFTPSPTHWDTRSIFGLDLPRFIKHTPYTEANHTAGTSPFCTPSATDGTVIGCDTWHMATTGMFFIKHISETMFASELFSGLRARKIDLDATAIAYCHQHNIPAPTKQKALSALVSEFVEHMQDVNNESSSTPPKTSQHNSEGPQLKTPQQADPATTQRLIALEHQLATANLTISHLRGQPTPLPSQPAIIRTQPAPTANTQPDNTKATSADFSPIAPRNLQLHLDSSGHESALYNNPLPTDVHSPPPVVDITSSPGPGASQETALYSPSPQHQEDDSKAATPHHHHTTHPHPSLAAKSVSPPHQHTTLPASHRPATSNTDTTSQSSKPTPSDTSKNKANALYSLAATPPYLRSSDNPRCLALRPPNPKCLSMQCFNNQPSVPNGFSKTSPASILRVASCDGSVRSRTCRKNKKQNAAPTSTRCCKHTPKSLLTRDSSSKPMRLRGASQYASLTNSRPNPSFGSYASLPKCQSDYWICPDPPILPMYSKPRG